MIMKIELSEEKAKAINRSIDKCYSALDLFFTTNGIDKKGQGIYSCDNYGLMALAQVTLSDCEWFIKIVENWHCNFVNNDLDWHMEDCLKAYYDVTRRNNRI